MQEINYGNNKIRYFLRLGHPVDPKDTHQPEEITDVYNKWDQIKDLSYTFDKFVNNNFIDERRLREWEETLTNKRQIIFYGAPGTGKTFVSKELSKYLISKYGESYKIIQFHPSYSYEDFVEGIRPILSLHKLPVHVRGSIKVWSIKACMTASRSIRTFIQIPRALSIIIS
jgi:Cdc6-like AAA superfamily ATPase